MNNKLLSLIAPIFVICGCEFVAPEGVPVRMEADGIIDAREEARLDERLENFEKLSIIDDEFKNFINDIDVFFRNEFERQGLKYGSFIDNLHLYITQDSDELAEEYREHNLMGMPDGLDGFYSDNNDTVYITKASLTGITIIFQHEIGHGMRDGAEEMASMAMEKYSKLKIYALNNEISKPFVRLMGSSPNNTAQTNNKYTLGSIGFAVQSNKHNGNLEEAVVHIMEAPYFFLEKDIAEEIEKRGGLTEAYKSNMKELIHKDGFRKSFHNLSDEDFEYLKEYLLKIF